MEHTGNTLEKTEQTLGTQLQKIQSQVDVVDKRTIVVEQRMNTMEDSQKQNAEKVQQQFEQLWAEVSALKAARDADVASSAGSAVAPGGQPRAMDEDWMPLSQRRKMIVGGWPNEVRKAEVERVLRVAMHRWNDEVEEIYCPGKRRTFGIVKFKTASGMWSVLKEVKASGYPNVEGVQLWMNCEKTKKEREKGKVLGKAVRVITANLPANVEASEVEIDFGVGCVWVGDPKVAFLKMDATGYHIEFVQEGLTKVGVTASCEDLLSAMRAE